MVKVTGKGLSSNDFSAALLNKLNSIADGAEVNVQADWNNTDSASDAFIKNKPASFPPSSHTHTKAQISDMPTKLSQFTNCLLYTSKAQPQRNFSLSQSSAGDPASITMTFDLLEDKDGNFAEIVEISDEAK